MFDLNSINGYELTNKIYNKENDITIYLLTHIKTNAKIVLMDNDDINRSFTIAFRTPVRNSKGIPHILEHSVLCGSKKYDVKDPFIELVKGSLNTFLNAMTGNDITFYPVASTNEKDFKNLVDVYLDSVFFPKCVMDKKVFMQEGWHYEVTSNNELDVNGIVLNEMRGDLSNESSIINYNILENLYKGTNNEFISGGSPKEIINLSYEEFCKFHSDYYNPSNSIIYFYGDLNMNEILSYLDNEYLSKFDKKEKAKYDLVKEFDRDRNTISYYNVEKKEDNQNHVTINYVLDYKRNALYHIVLKILDYILFSSDSAIIKERFIKEGLSLDVESYVEEGLLKGFFSVVVKNVKDEDKEKIIKVFDEEIDKLIKNGISKDKLESTISTTHFHYLEEDYTIPKGLEIIFSSLNSYLYDEDIDTFLKYVEVFESFKNEDLNSNNNIFIKVLKEVFKDNKYRGIGYVVPKANLVLQNEKELREELAKRKSSFTDSEIEKIKKEDEELKKYQNAVESDENLKKIPKISISDIDKVRNHNTYELDKINDKTIIKTYENLKGLTYLRFNFPLNKLREEDLYFVAILSDIITMINLKDLSYEELEQKIDKVSGGISTSVDVYEDEVYFCITLKFLNEKLDDNLNILKEILYKNDFSEKSNMRIKSVLDTLLLDAKNSFMFKGHLSSINRNLSRMSKRHRIVDMILNNGIAYNMFIDDLNKKYIENASIINEYLEKLYNKIINFDDVLIDTLVEKVQYDNLKNKIKNFFDNDIIKDSDKNTKVDNSSIDKIFDFNKYKRKNDKEAFIVSSDVNFVSRGGSFDPKSYNGHLSVLSTILNREYLWDNIRVLGGAYGSFAMISRSGVGGYVSYRDPNLSKSDNVYKNIVSYVENLDFSEEKIDKFIIGTISSLDSPPSKINLHKRNVTNYVNKIDNNEIDKLRTEILNTRLNDLKKCINVVKDINDKNEISAIISSKNKDEALKYYENVVNL